MTLCPGGQRLSLRDVKDTTASPVVIEPIAYVR
jgi:hypothetical protein